MDTELQVTPANGTVSQNGAAEKKSPAGEEEQERGNWGGKLDFIVTLIGFCVGLGNVWRFPYLVFKNGGGAFLIPYFLMLFLCGIPLFATEVSHGQFASLGPIAVWTMSPMMKGIGIASVIVGAMIALYYNVIVAWSFYYFFASMTSKLPWTSCGNSWNTPSCYDNTSSPAANFTNRTTPTEEYFYRNVLGMENDSGLENLGAVKWQLAVLLFLAWFIILAVIIKGIDSLGKVSYFTSLFPYVMMTILLVRGATLDGALDGVKFYVTPDWSKLGTAQLWGDAATQIFYSLGCCQAVLVSMASFNKFKNNIFRDALLIPLINCFTSFYCGFVTFTTLGYMAKAKGVPIQEVVKSGPGLVFVVYPEGLSKMPAAPVWSVLFFLMMIMLGFSSQFSTAEGVIASIMDEFPNMLRREGIAPYLVRGVAISIFLLLGLPLVTQGGFMLFTILDTYTGGYPLIVIGILELFIINIVYGIVRWEKDIYMMLGRTTLTVFVIRFFAVFWCVVSPILLIFVLGFKASQEKGPSMDGYTYPPSGTVLAGLIVAFPLSAIALNFIIRYFYGCCQNGGKFAFSRTFEVFKEGMRPSPEWGPALPENRTGVYAPLNGVCTAQDSQPSLLYDHAVPINKVSPIIYHTQDENNPPPYTESAAKTEISHL